VLPNGREHYCKLLSKGGRRVHQEPGHARQEEVSHARRSQLTSSEILFLMEVEDSQLVVREALCRHKAQRTLVSLTGNGKVVVVLTKKKEDRNVCVSIRAGQRDVCRHRPFIACKHCLV
jgi:hypothetical protein